MGKNLSLSQLWSKTNGILIEPPIIYLRVQQAEQPVSYVPNEVWLASYEKIEGEPGWRVGIWGNFLRCVQGEDLAAVKAILKSADMIVGNEGVGAAEWTPVPVPPKNNPEAHI